MATAHAVIFINPRVINARIGIHGDDGVVDSELASFPYGPNAETGDREELEALIRILNWYKNQTNWVGTRTYEIFWEEE